MLTCSGTNIDYVNDVVPEPLRAKVRLIHHGVNLDGFQPRLSRRGDRATGEGQEQISPSPASPGHPVSAPLILSVGRLVEKKGFPDLIAACAQLKQAGRQFRCAIYGEGPLHGELSALIERLDLADCVTLAGERGQAELIPIFQRADYLRADAVRDRGWRPRRHPECAGRGDGLRPAGGQHSGRGHSRAGAPRRKRPAGRAARRATRWPMRWRRCSTTRQRREQMGARARATVVEHFRPARRRPPDCGAVRAGRLNDVTLISHSIMPSISRSVRAYRHTPTRLRHRRSPVADISCISRKPPCTRSQPKHT